MAAAESPARGACLLAMRAGSVSRAAWAVAVVVPPAAAAALATLRFTDGAHLRVAPAFASSSPSAAAEPPARGAYVLGMRAEVDEYLYGLQGGAPPQPPSSGQIGAQTLSVNLMQPDMTCRMLSSRLGWWLYIYRVQLARQRLAA